MRDQLTTVVTGIIEGYFRKNLREGRGQFDQCGVLFWRKIILHELRALHDPPHRHSPSGTTHKILGVDHRITEPRRDFDVRFPLGVLLIPFVERLGVTGRIGAHVGNLDTDGTIVGNSGVTGALFQVERLINGAIEIEHEVDAETAVIMQDIEAHLAEAADIIMDYKLIYHALQGGEIPTATAQALELGGGQRISAQAVTVGRCDLLGFNLRLLPVAARQRTEPTLHAVSIITMRIHPSNHASPRMK